MKNSIKILGIGLLATSCAPKPTDVREIATLPPIFPDCANVTVPPNIAPLTFALADSCAASHVLAEFSSGSYKTLVQARDGHVAIAPRKWRRLIEGGDIKVRIIAKVGDRWQAYMPFDIYVSPDSIDSHMAYRLIEPGYEIWNEMGIYQRDLESYDQKAIVTNRQTNNGCMNCHSFCQQSPDQMLMHMRVDYPGTYLAKIVDGKTTIERLDTKTPQTITALVYPSWHPSGKYVAFSVNNTKQLFHTTDPNRIEVFDYESDVVVYDVDEHEIVSSPLLMSSLAFETFPTFSADGTKLYFCSADSVAMPGDYDKAYYRLCSIDFDPQTRTFGEKVDTLVGGWGSAEAERSVSFPRVSPDGTKLMFTLHDYGNFSIWHHEADLRMLDLATGDVDSLEALNSDDTESYHSWSSNGRWVVFSSRRLDGLYTRPFIAHVDADGSVSKPFVVPQKEKDYYTYLMKSYNVPEFVNGEVPFTPYQLREASRGPTVKIEMKNK